jgi:CRP-like cAMP-binding protein
MTMTAGALRTQKFARRTSLAPHEYHKNFHKIDEDIITALTSPEADAVTPLMSKIYLRLVNAPAEFWEQKGILHFTAQVREGKMVKSSSVLSDYLGVARATVNKALKWMHGEGIIGYFAGKNGVGVRIFLNRAVQSIGTKPASGEKKILPFSRGSSGGGFGSQNEPAFKDPFGDSDGSDSDLNPHAPKNGADTKTVGETTSDPTPPSDNLPIPVQRTRREVEPPSAQANAVTVDELVQRLKGELEPCVKSAAAQAASQAAAREVAQTRKWFEERALPKAVRVAQHETYNLLRKLGTLNERKERARADLQVGRSQSDHAAREAKPLTPEEITDIAETCIALLETQGKKVDVTLAEISSEGGGWLLPQDAPRVREEAERLLRARSERR